jgi:hypothetical protein
MKSDTLPINDAVRDYLRGRVSAALEAVATLRNPKARFTPLTILRAQLLGEWHRASRMGLHNMLAPVVARKPRSIVLIAAAGVEREALDERQAMIEKNADYCRHASKYSPFRARFTRDGERSDAVRLFMLEGIRFDRALRLARLAGQSRFLYSGWASDDVAQLVETKYGDATDIGPFDPLRLGEYYSMITGTGDASDPASVAIIDYSPQSMSEGMVIHYGRRGMLARIEAERELLQAITS